MNIMDFEQIAFQAGSGAGGRDFLREILAREISGHWFAGEPVALERGYARARTALGEAPDVLALLNLHLLLALLDGHPRPPRWAAAWAEAHLPVRTFFPSGFFAMAARGRWQCVPLLVVRDGEARLRRLVVGYAPGPPAETPWPPRAEALLDPSARKALIDAVRAAERIVPAPPGMGARVFPLAVPDGPDRFAGRSLGLPAALGLMAAAEDRALPRRLAATGDLGPDGAVSPVGHLDRKVERAEAGDFRVLLHPPEAELSRNGLTAIPVPTLARARLLADLHRPDRVGELAMLSGMLDDPDRFIRNVDGMPPEWLLRIRETGDHRPMVRALARRPERFARLADRFERAVYRGRTPLAAAMAGLVAEADLEPLSGAAPLAAFRWCTAALSLCNHTGRVPEAREWSRRAEALIPAARRADLDRVVDHFNHRLVARHNRYRFDPDLPPHLSELLKLLMDQYRMQCAADCPTRMVLGRAWGTIAQNHAFCGPDHLERVRELTTRARRALGEDTVPEHREEWLRQFNYLAYALLDAGPDHFDEARSTLFRYLDIEAWSDLWPGFSRLDRWRHALIARFLAEAGGESEQAAFLAALAARPPIREAVFPWPLWCFNAGRVARLRGDADGARTWFGKSLDLCMDPATGPSVRVMALLPLSALRDAEALPADFPETWDRIRSAAEALDPEHFAPLKTASPETLLATVAAEPRRFFPFIYR